MGNDALDDRVERLEARLETVETTLERYRRQHALLLTAIDVDALEDPVCPECDGGPLVKESGITWARAVCHDCDTVWPLDG